MNIHVYNANIENIFSSRRIQSSNRGLDEAT